MADPGNDTSSEAAGGRAGEWSPAELDVVEDALERWTAAELEDVPEDSTLSPRMRERLESYRELLAMTRAELPLEDVSDSLLAGVLAEAARSGSAAPARELKVAEAVRVGFWERLRRSMLLPGLALAGSAALLLWMVQPGDEAPTTLATQTTPARLTPEASPAPAAPKLPELREAPEMDELRGGAAEEKQADEAPGAAAPEPAAVLADPAEAAVSKDSKLELKGDRGKAKSIKKSELPAESYPGLDDVPSDAAADKDALRDTLEQADRARRKGRCDLALGLYQEATGMSGPDSERAQARAGYGLCLQAQGNDAAAMKYFESAGKISPSINAWIKRERGDSSPKKAPAKPSSKAHVDEPFK
ncbi:tetratricopeptide repeat protein [Nannocystis sp.]|uniref:tetratricopeptide repeat protein n=1 Tax=Nannocystis sp. TaxID=1962667 RepID=UPI0025F5062A|nr:tetratricopeptide repeat protein [Nannocystis sp.]MBK7827729.1 tetratricopeptide repeat protein [Nannocystis sp.]